MLMHDAVNFDNQPALQANEIDHKGPDRMLAAKPQSPLLPAPQDIPQRPLGLGSSGSQ